MPILCLSGPLKVNGGIIRYLGGPKKMFFVKNVTVSPFDLLSFRRKKFKGGKLASVESRSAVSNFKVNMLDFSEATISGNVTLQIIQRLNLDNKVLFRFASGNYRY